MFGGIANNLRYFYYSGVQVFLPDGRGYIHLISLLNHMRVSYEKLEVSNLLDNQTFLDRIILFLPKDLLEHNLSGKITGIFFGLFCF